MSDVDLAQDIQAAREEEARLYLGESSDTLVHPPRFSSQSLAAMGLTSEMVDQALANEYLGDGQLLRSIFRGHYLCHNAAFSNPKLLFNHIYKFVGTHWQQDLARCYQEDFLTALGAAYKFRAEDFLALARAAAAQAEEVDKAEEKRALKEEAALAQAKAKLYLARAKKCLASPRMMHAAAVAFSGADGLGLPLSQDWNSHPELLPCLNGTIKLANGDLIPSRPEDFFNKIAPWPYLGLTAPCPTWIDSINKIFGYDARLTDYMQQVAGAMATGYQTKDFIVALGPLANNGKSVFFETLALCLGDFAASIEVELLLQQSQRNASAAHPEILRLRDVRFAHTQEADSRDVLDVGKVKKYTAGGDSVAIRTLHSDLFHKFSPAFTLVVHTNKPPRLAEGDRGLAQRLRIIPFQSRFIDPADGAEDRDKLIFHARDRSELTAAFKKEMPGILAWVTKGAIKFIANNHRLPPPPPTVIAESQNYMLEYDLVGQFLAAKSEKREGFSEPGRDLYRAFRIWCEDELELDKHSIMSSTRFGRELKNHLSYRRQKGGVEYLDIKLSL